MTTDHGRQFQFEVFHSMAKLCGIQLSRTTADHSTANGLVERLHRKLKAAIMCHWTEALKLVFLGIRMALKEACRHQ
jgi:hypothetical protein